MTFYVRKFLHEDSIYASDALLGNADYSALHCLNQCCLIETIEYDSFYLDSGCNCVTIRCLDNSWF